MRFCLACRSLSSSGPICSKCGRSFDGRLCPQGHLSDLDAKFCSQCRSQALTDGTASIRLGGLLRLLLIAGFLFFLWRFVASSGWGASARHSLSSAYGWLVLQIVQIGFLLLFSWFFFGLFSQTRPLQKAVERMMVSLLVIPFKIIQAVLTLLIRLIAGVSKGGVNNKR